MTEIFVIAHDMRSTHNVGSLFRTAEGMGVKKLYLTGYTPYPIKSNDVRLPHVAEKLDRQIAKTALNASETLEWEQFDNIYELLEHLRQNNITVVALEQTERSVPLHTYKTPQKIALILGTELTGLPIELLEKIDTHVQIEMFGNKESFNVVQAAAMALYHFRFISSNL